MHQEHWVKGVIYNLIQRTKSDKIINNKSAYLALTSGKVSGISTSRGEKAAEVTRISITPR